MNTALLALHLTGAAGLGITLVALIVTLWRNQAEEKFYLRLAKVIAVLTSSQFASGLLLAVLTPGMSPLKVCSNMAIYWAVVFAGELAIVLRLRKQPVSVDNV